MFQECVGIEAWITKRKETDIVSMMAWRNSFKNTDISKSLEVEGTTIMELRCDGTDSFQVSSRLILPAIFK